jgi:eukaryotic-like serine/threonine-protein kinase
MAVLSSTRSGTDGPDIPSCSRLELRTKPCRHVNGAACEPRSEDRTRTAGRVIEADVHAGLRSLRSTPKGAPLPLSRVKQLMIDMLRGLAHAHSRKIIHRDIKPANILIGPEQEGKLSDFGLALDLASPDSLAVKDYAYVMHLAPEVTKPQDYSVASDIYATSVTLYRLINGDRALSGLPIAEVRRRTSAGTYPNRGEYKDYVPKRLRDLVNKTLELNPSKRFATADELRRALERVPVKVDWEERDVIDGTRWRGRGSGLRYEILRKRTVLGWAVVTRRARAGSEPRLVSALCKANLGEDEARKFSRRLLQDLTVGKLSKS